jgi:CYTH domain-containing protein
MGTEIERKFLVDPEHLRRTNPALPPGSFLDQGFLCNEPVVRVRLARKGTAGLLEAWITVKGKGLLERAEYEYSIPPADAQGMLSLCKSRITKVRHELEYAGRAWTVDEFLGTHQGLWLAEIELDDAGQTFDVPPWAREEVTNDRRFQNVNLAAHPERFWETRENLTGREGDKEQ